MKLRPGTPLEEFDSWQYQGMFSNKKHPVPDRFKIPGAPPRLNKQGFKALGANLLGQHCRFRSTYLDGQNQRLPGPVQRALSDIGTFETAGDR
ncbi:hypothetical protein, partial [Flaviflexus sp.]|uniref:hypothetical protein n=1 Tax=Flaviflexus sp. TaxID=1969482 RepID=UPI003F903D8D